LLELRLFQEVEEGRGRKRELEDICWRKKELEDITRKSCGLPTPGYSKRKTNNRQLPIITWLLAYTNMFFWPAGLAISAKKAIFVAPKPLAGAKTKT